MVSGAISNVIAKRQRPAEALLQIAELFGGQHRGQRIVCTNLLPIVFAPPIILELKEPERANFAVRAAIALPCLAFAAFDAGAKVRLPFGGRDERRCHLHVTIGGHGDVTRIPIGRFRRESRSQCKNCIQNKYFHRESIRPPPE